MPDTRGGQAEGHKETDEREVGTKFRQREPQVDLPEEGTHVVEEQPRLRGHFVEKPVDDEGGT